MRAFLVIALAAGAAGALGYEQGMPSLEVPYSMEPGKLELVIQHRFVGKAFEDMFDNFFGADLGANVYFGIRYFLPAGFELGASHQRSGGEYGLSAGYNAEISSVPLGLRAGAGLFSVEKPTVEDPGNRDTGFYGSACVESEPVAGLFMLAGSLGYDSDAGRACVGFGLDVSANERLSFVGEYFPAMDGDSLHPALGNDCWTAGMRLNTWGHQFGLLLTNSTAIGLRSLAAGVYTVDDQVRLGFSVRRQLSF
jgi:hypothetical protein